MDSWDIVVNSLVNRVDGPLSRKPLSVAALGFFRAALVLLFTQSLTLAGALPLDHTLSEEQAKFGEYEVRVAFLLVFAKYTEWPESTLPAGSPLVVGMMGEWPVGFQDLTKASIKGRRVILKQFRNPSEIQSCQILYFPSDQERLLPELKKKLAAMNVLTVGETSRFIGYGGALQVFSEDGRLRFVINRTALTQASLRVEAKALNLAKQVLGS